MRRWALFLGAFWLAGAAGAQPWGAIQNPPGVEISLHLRKQGPYRQGETIPVEMKLPKWSPGQPPPPEQWPFAGLLLEPALACGSVAKPCFESEGGVVTGLMVQHDYTFLNRWLPPLPPGHYRAALLARKLVLTSHEPASSTYGYAEPPQYAVSNTVEFDILAASAEWIQQAVSACVATLTGPPPASREASEIQYQATEQLAYLDEPGAWQASLSLMSDASYALLQGLRNTRQPARVCELMQASIGAPEQVVPSGYLQTMQQVCVNANVPPPPPTKDAVRPVSARIVTTPLPAVAAPPPDPALEAYFRRLRTYQSGLWETATASLATSLPRKHGEAKAAALTSLLEYLPQHPNPRPSWVPELTREFIALWPSVDVPNQRRLLDLFANTIRSPEVEPLLESVLDRWKPGEYYEAVHAALAELNQIDPRKAQARILAELQKEQTWLDTPQLELLPANAVQPMDDALIDILVASQKPPSWNPGLRMAAIAKYATPGALPRIKAIYESLPDSCQPELMAYFVRVDPAYADRVFHGHAWDMQAPPTRCTVQYFLRTAPLAMGAPLEKYMEAYLMHSNAYVKTTAAHQLGLYGSASAEKPLWDALRYFHEYWKGKRLELEQNGEGVHLEVELRNAIAYGRHWLATEQDLKTIEALCISGQCMGDTRQDLANWQQPMRIDFAGPSGGWRARVAQYYGIASIAGLKDRLAQFPRGTRFVLAATDTDPAAVTDLRDFAMRRGLVLEPDHRTYE